MLNIDLNGLWKMKRTDSEEWLDAVVPGSIYNDLLNNKKIDDPYYRDNEKEAIKAAEFNYEYEREFYAGEETLKQDKVVLCCEGLDTLSEVFINGALIAKTNNMHRAYEFNVKSIVQAGKNVIRIVFYSPTKYIAEKYKENPIWGCNAMEGFPYLRKAHYMFGWDWGPVVPDMGIWRNISIKAFNAGRIDEVYVTQKHTGNKVELDIRINTERYSKGELIIKAKVVSPNGEEVQVLKTYEQDEEHLYMTIANPMIWWPSGYGEQPLYNVEVVLEHEGRVIDKKNLNIGLRTLTIRREKDQWGESFEFNINGKSIFAMGGNYIPEDNILARCCKEKTEKLILSAVAANMNCIRVWGGGVYQEDYFYDLCDKYGLIVWQDFMFACADYELSEEFAENISREIEDNIKRIRHHASLGLWCGNNENEAAILWWGISKRPTTHEEYIKQFEELIPALVKKHDPNTFYWPSSPSKKGSFIELDNDNMGDAHFWDVWHMLKPFTAYRDRYFRFVSEFGFESFPGMKTIESFTLPEDRNPFSYVMENHQKHIGGNGKIIYYISEYLKYPKNLDSLLYVSQIAQAEAIKCGVEHWRRHRGRCMGAIYWQLNDSWPVASWASIDSFGRWKALHYFAKNFFNRVLVSAHEEGNKAEIFLTNESLASVEGRIVWKLRDNVSQVILEGTKEVKIDELASKKCIELDFNKVLATQEAMRSHYLEVYFETKEGVASFNTVLFVRPKHFNFISPQIQYSIDESEDKFTVRLTSKAFAKYVELELKNSDCLFSDNYFDLSAKEVRVISINKNTLSKDMTINELKAQLIVRSVYDSYENF